MADSGQKWVELVAKLNELTQDDKLKWKVIPAPASNNALAKLEAFAAPYKDKQIRLIVSHMAAGLLSVTRANPMAYRLEIGDAQGNPVWQIPTVVGLSDLYDSIKFQLAGMKGLLDDLMSE